MRVGYCTERDVDRWEQYVEACEHATLYHRMGWKRVIERSLGHKTFYLMARAGERVYGILPLVLIRHPIFGRSLVSMPFLNYGGVCAENHEAESALLEEATRIASQEEVDYLELRQPRKLSHEMPTSESKVTMYVNLSRDPEVVWRRIIKKSRNKIRKGEKTGLRAEFGREERLAEFYETFARNQRALGSPVFSKGFFETVLSEFPSEVTIVLVMHGKKPVAASFVGTFKNSVEGLWACSLRESLKLYPNEFLYWKNLEFGCNRGFTWFNLGRSTKDSGSYRFKKKFGAVTKQLYWQYYLHKAGRIPRMDPSALRYRVVRAIWKRFPLRVTTAMGSYLRKYMSQ